MSTFTITFDVVTVQNNWSWGTTAFSCNLGYTNFIPVSLVDLPALVIASIDRSLVIPEINRALVIK